jgi:hypothetical protein
VQLLFFTDLHRPLPKDLKTHFGPCVLTEVRADFTSAQ